MTRPDPTVGLLVGREPHRRALRERWAAADAGRGSFVVVRGESGAGKSSLVEELAATVAPAGAVVLTGRCYDMSLAPPYAAWIDGFADDRRPNAAPETVSARRDLLIAVTQRPTLPEEVRRQLVRLATPHPVLLVLEDLQWADLATCELLRHVARNVARYRLMIVVTVAEDGLDRSSPLRRLLPVIEREATAERINVGRLPAAALRALVDARYALSEADAARLTSHLSDLTRGHALFAVELLGALEEQHVLAPAADGSWRLGELTHVGVPPRLRQVIDARLARIGDETLDRLAIAAVIGPDVPFSLWASVCDGAEDDLVAVLEEATSARIVEPTPDGTAFRFVHSLVRDALHDRVFPVRRRLVHRRVAQVLAAVPGADPDAVARHFRDAADARCGPWLVRAGVRAENVGALRTAVERYEAALGPLEQSGAPPVDRALVQLALALLRRMDDSWRALTSIDAAVALAEQEPATDAAQVRAAALLGRGIVRCYAGQLEPGLADLRAGVGALDVLGDGAATATMAAWGASMDTLLNAGALVYWLAVCGRTDEALRLGDERAHRVVGTTTNVRVTAGVAGCHWGSAFAHALRGRVAQAQFSYAAAAAAFSKLDQHRLAFVALRDELVFAVLPYRADEPDERRRLVAELGRMASEGNAIGAFVDAIDNVRYPLLQLMLVEGRWEELREVVDTMGHYGVPLLRHVVGTVLGPVALAQGDTALAWRIVGETWPGGSATEPGAVEIYHTLPQLRLAVELALDEGDLPGARAWLRCYERRLDFSGAVLGRSEALVLAARCALAAGSLDDAWQFTQRALAAAAEPRQPLALLAAHRMVLEVAARRGVDSSDAVHLAEALRLADACRAPYERGLTLLAAAAHGLASDRRPGASSGDSPSDSEVAGYVREARVVLEPLGAAPALARLTALERQLGDRSPGPGEYPAHLTPREAEVLGLLAGGLSDREIAGELQLSPRTVGRHVENAYRKLGVHRRAEAAVFAHRHGLVADDVRRGHG